jgi:hypothetical protein
MADASREHWPRATWLTIFTALTAAVLLVHGYHPLAEDGGLYAAGIEHTLDPTLFPYATAFVTEHLRFSIFAPFTAGIVHLTHLNLAWTLLLLYLISIASTLAASRAILRRCSVSEASQLVGISLLAVWWTLPVAATSLLLMDPYVTARSLTLPLSLFAIAFALDDWHSPRPILATALCLVIAALFHPLMAAYALAFVLGIRVTRLRRPIYGWATLTLLALATAAAIHHHGTPATGPLLAAELSRYYWFLSEWHTYEWLGLLGPLLVLAALHRLRPTPPTSRLTQAAISLGCIATLVCLLFARESDPIHLIARLQPLRIFLTIYALLALLLGATLTERLRPRQRRYLPALLLLLIAAGMFAAQRDTFPASIHLELPDRTNPNPWVRAFLWARDNTPPNVVFALDARYINQPGEDAQTFRAISLRSALPDFSKDGGEAAITPALASAWQRAAIAQSTLSTSSDAERDARILPLGATWMIVRAATPTAHPCPYVNNTVKVCRLI